jgi:hypothetical protein
MCRYAFSSMITIAANEHTCTLPSHSLLPPLRSCPQKLTQRHINTAIFRTTLRRHLWGTLSTTCAPYLLSITTHLTSSHWRRIFLIVHCWLVTLSVVHVSLFSHSFAAAKTSLPRQRVILVQEFSVRFCTKRYDYSLCRTLISVTNFMSTPNSM